MSNDIKDFWKDEIHLKYPEGCDMNQFKHLSEVSSYNWNYYVGFNSDLLFGHSDDDDLTEWYLIRGDNKAIYLGISSVTGRDILQQVSNI